MRHTVVTGGNGFLGRAVVRRLCESGHPACVLVRPGRGDEARRGLEAFGAADVAIREVAFEDVGSVRRALDGVDVRAVVHLAGRRTMPDAGPDAVEANVRDNLETTLRLVAALAPGMEGRVVLASSAEVYGKAPAPFRETQRPEPATPYGAAKLAAEILGAARARAIGVRFAAARLGAVYGPGQRPTMFVAKLVDAAIRRERFTVTCGAQTRDLVYVDDAADALVALAHETADLGPVYNVGSGESVELGSVARAVLDASGHAFSLDVRTGPAADWDIVDYRLEVSAIRRDVGWAASTPLTAGLERTMAAARAARSAG